MTSIGRSQWLPAGLLVIVLLTLSAVVGRAAFAAEIVNATAAGIAVDGFDTVAYFELGHPVKGRADHSVDYKGVRWLFATPEHRTPLPPTPNATLQNTTVSAPLPFPRARQRRLISSTAGRLSMARCI